MMKVGNSAPRVGLKPTLLTNWRTELTNASPNFPDAINLSMGPEVEFGGNHSTVSSNDMKRETCIAYR